MTSGNVTSVSPNLMVNNQLSAKDGDKSGGFLDVMSKNVAKSDKKADTQNQVSGNDVKDDKAKVGNTKAQTPDDKKVTTKDNKADNIGYVLVVHKIDDGDDGNILQADASDNS